MEMTIGIVKGGIEGAGANESSEFGEEGGDSASLVEKGREEAMVEFDRVSKVLEVTQEFSESIGEASHELEGRRRREGLRREGPDISEGHGAHASRRAAIPTADGDEGMEQGGTVDRDSTKFVGGAVGDLLIAPLEIDDLDIGGPGEAG